MIEQPRTRFQVRWVHSIFEFVAITVSFVFDQEEPARGRPQLFRDFK